MEWNERYARQTILPEIGAAGQARLARARVLVVGAGALGTPALYYLAAAGVGTLGIADDDALELSNLHRQILYRSEDIGKPKAEMAAARLHEFNPDIATETHPFRITADNAVALFRDYDIVLDATDRLETKFLINDACAGAERPLVHAAILGFEARVAVFDARTGPCLRCLFPEPPTTPALTCSEAGVLGAIPGVAGSLQALEAIKWILKESPSDSPLPPTGDKRENPLALPLGRAAARGKNPLALPLGRAAAKGETEGDSGAAQKESPSDSPFLASRGRGRSDDESALQVLLGRLWLMDGRTLQTRVVKLPRDPACPICRHDPSSIRLAPEPEAVQHVTPEELDEHPEALLIDVREDEEWAGGHLEGAMHYPLSRLAEAIPELPKRERYVTYCAHGIRSETAARLLSEAGYRNVFSLTGGIAAVCDEARRPAETPE